MFDVIWSDIIKVIEFVWPIAIWSVWVSNGVRISIQNQKDNDILFYERRGKQGMRDRSIKGFLRRKTYRLRKGK